MPQHTVSLGESVSKIAADNKLADYREIWNHPSNRSFANGRDPNLLYPGDELFVPEQRQKDLIASTGMTHQFRKKVPRNRIRLQMLDGNMNPIAEADYTLTVGDDTYTGKTDDEGRIMKDMAVDVDSGTLEFGGRTIELEIGSLAPLDKVEGIQARLQNLGYAVEAVDGDGSTDAYKDAVKAFQADHKLSVDGIVGPRTRGKLKDFYGC